MPLATQVLLVRQEEQEHQVPKEQWAPLGQQELLEQPGPLVFRGSLVIQVHLAALAALE